MISLVSHTTVPSPLGGAPHHVLIISPDPRIFPLWMLRQAVWQSILTETGEAVSCLGMTDGNMRLVVKSIARTRQLLEQSSQLPGILRCLPRD